MTTAGSLPVPNSWINDRYGSRRGLLKFMLFEVKRITGQYASLKVPEHASPKRLVFICMGNICRSPVAEAIAISKGFNAISFGLDTRGNDCADPRAIKFASENGIDLKKHRTRKIQDYCPEIGDLVIGMEPKHVSIFQEYSAGVTATLLGLYTNKPRAYIHDPYNTNLDFFIRCEESVLNATCSLLNHVK